MGVSKLIKLAAAAEVAAIDQVLRFRAQQMECSANFHIGEFSFISLNLSGLTAY
jgi:hypothetical protein